MPLKRKVYLTRRLLPEAMEHLQSLFDLTTHRSDRQLSRKEIVRGINGTEGLISMLSDPIDARVIRSCPSLKIIANYAVGYNNIDLAAATARRIAVTNTPGVLTEATADLAWALILSVGRRLVEADRLARSGRWRGWAPTQFLGTDIVGKTLGIIGLGRIGAALAKRAQGFRMKVLYHNRKPVEKDLESKLGAQYTSLEGLLSCSDFVSLHLPLLPETFHLIGKSELSLMKPNSYLINTARGPIVDEKALIAALEKGRIAGAGLDVFEHEPHIPRRLMRLQNVVVLPHIGSASKEARLNMGIMVAENLSAVFSGKVPPHQVNPF